MIKLSWFACFLLYLIGQYCFKVLCFLFEPFTSQTGLNHPKLGEILCEDNFLFFEYFTDMESTLINKRHWRAETGPLIVTAINTLLELAIVAQATSGVEVFLMSVKVYQSL